METRELLDAVKARHSLRSDYALAKFLGISTQAVSRYRRHNTTMADDVGLRCASALRLDPGLVVVWLHAERTDCPPAQAALRQVAKTLEGSKHAA